MPGNVYLVYVKEKNKADVIHLHFDIADAFITFMAEMEPSASIRLYECSRKEKSPKHIENFKDISKRIITKGFG